MNQHRVSRLKTPNHYVYQFCRLNQCTNEIKKKICSLSFRSGGYVSKRIFKNGWRDQFARIVLCFDDPFQEKLIGWLIEFDDGSHIYVRKSHRRIGIGRTMIDLALKEYGIVKKISFSDEQKSWCENLFTCNDAVFG